MAELVLQAGDDHVQRLAHENDPVRAIVELIWNSVDAEATHVEVELERGDLDAITKVTVTDDGHGISRDELESTFGRIGDSWKRGTSKTKNGKRGLHGEKGEGRLRVFALGSRVQWVSHSEDIAAQKHRIEINGTTARRHVFPYQVGEGSGRMGTVVTAWNETQKSLLALEPEHLLPALRSHFAPVLLNDDDLTITYVGEALDPADEIAHEAVYTLQFGDADVGGLHDATLRIIEWKSGKHRAIYYGKDAEHFVSEESGKDVESQFQFSAYITWSGLDAEGTSAIGLGNLAHGPIGELWTAARDGIRSHFTSRRRERRRDQVVKWKEDKVYPYEGEPATEAEEAERLVFDVVSGTLSQQVPGKKNDARLMLTFLRDALRYDPDQLATIIQEVAALSPADRDTLTRLLSETTLPAIIKAANLVTSRNKFLLGLEHLLFDPTDSDEVGERDHLHKLLERELWIFGESYHLMNSERGLTELLRTHLRLEGLPTRNLTPVRRWDERSGRVDLHLGMKSQEFDLNRHLVVELKAPGITLGRKELDQVEDYANVVLENSAFATDKAEWDFILIGTDYNELVENRLRGEAQGLGQVLAPERKPGRPRVRVYVRRWRDVLDENRRRLNFMTNNLELDPSISEGLGYIREQYGDLLPEVIANPTKGNEE
jgi:Histidine kinase-, DNA gyrase B-, and HSP90-like ATPase